MKKGVIAMNIKLLAKVASIGGMILGFAGTALSGWASNHAMKEAVQEEVAKALSKQ